MIRQLKIHQLLLHKHYFFLFVCTKFLEIIIFSGDILLKRPIQDLQAFSPIDKPIVFSVVAEEVRSNPREQPSQSTTVQLALIPPKLPNTLPQFASPEYFAELDENAPSGTKLRLKNAEILVQPGFVVKLELENNNNTFEIFPTVVEGTTKFEIRVRDPKLLDYEKNQVVECDIVLREVQGEVYNFTSKAKLIVKINNVNDNPPRFYQEEWNGSVAENSPQGTSVLRVEAYDIETNSSKFMRYHLSKPDDFEIEEKSGLIYVAKSLDAERKQSYKLMVEAIGDGGKGLTSSSTVTINLIDANDESPRFERNPFEFIVSSSRKNFTVPALVVATDADVSSPYNEVRYEIIDRVTNLSINSVTGELLIRPVWTRTEVLSFMVRAYDGGVPRLWSEVEVKVYPPETMSKQVVFIVSGSNPDRQALEDTLTTVVGSEVDIEEVRPYNGFIPGAVDISKGSDRTK